MISLRKTKIDNSFNICSNKKYFVCQIIFRCQFLLINLISMFLIDLNSMRSIYYLVLSMIQKLREDVADQICSQQIITSLNQCIKQLIDNSIDAKATLINIKLTDFGKRAVQIYDNGVGIKSVQLLGKKGTTSKTSVNPNQEILNNIKSLGFRGEALTSIAKLSKGMIIQTTYQMNQHFQYKKYDMKQMQLIQNKAVDPKTNPVSNTKIIIQQIFDCLPIRREELKQRSKQNLREVFNTTNQICLIYPQIKFVLCNDTLTGIDLLIQQPKYSSFDEIGWRKRIEDCFPGKLQDALVYITHQNIQGFVLNTIDSGSSRKNMKFSKNMSYMYLNRRPITPIKKIHKILDQIYKKYNPYTRYVYFLNLKLHPSCVDINLTPNKREVFIKLQFMEKIVEQLNSEINKKIIQKIGNLQDFKQKKSINQQLQPISQKRTKTFIVAKTEQQKSQQKSISKKSLENIRIQLKKGNKNSQPVFQSNALPAQGNSSLAERFKQKMGQNRNIADTIPRQQKKQQNPFANKPSSGSFLSELKHNLNKKMNLDSDNQNQINQNQVSQLKDQHKTGKIYEDKKFQVIRNSIEQRYNVNGGNQSNIIIQEMQPNLNSSQPHEHDQFQQSQNNNQRTQDQRFFNENENEIQWRQHSHVQINKIEQDDKQVDDNQTKNRKLSERKMKSSDREVYQNDLLGRTKRQLKEQVLPTLQQLSPLDLLTQRNRLNLRNNQNRLHNSEQPNDISHRHNHEDRNQTNQVQNGTINYINQHSAINKDNFKQFYIHGQFNHGFILASYNRKLFLIDQHAASQKDNFQRLMDTKFGFICQIQVKKISPMQADHIQMAQALLKQSGFSYQVQNRSQLKITKCPTFLKHTFNSQQFMEVVQNSKPLRELPIFYNSVASRACRSAVMIGDRLKKQQMRNILNRMSQLKSPWNCPHGRPSLIQLGNVTEKAKSIRMPRTYWYNEI